MRRTESAVARVPGTPPLRLLAVGDCNTAGKNESPSGASIPEKLAAWLERRGMATVLQNLGYTMSTSREGLARVQRDARPADVLLLNFGLVDAWVTSIPAVYLSYYPDNRLKKLGRKLLKSLKRRLRNGRLRQFIPVGEVVPLAEYERNMRRIIGAARAANPAVQIILWGTPPTRTSAERNANIARYNATLATLAAECGATYLATEPLLAALDVEATYLDEVHLAGAAVEQIAKALDEVLQTVYVQVRVA